MTKHGSTGHHSCSNQASATDSMGPMIDDLKRVEEGIPMFDAYLQQEVLVVAPVTALLCDKPRHSELLVMVEAVQGNTAECAWYVLLEVYFTAPDNLSLFSTLLTK